jgi:N-acetylmuramoyl-L-alanine amidase CwlA
MNIIRRDTPNKFSGGNRMEVIVIHQWDDPSKRPSLSGVLSWLTNPASEVSAHYIVSDKTVYKLAEESDRCWHARDANTFGIGIEIDPNLPGDTYKTVANLVRDIRSRRGNIPIEPHNKYVNTTCPGSIDLSRIERESKGVSMAKATKDDVNYLYRGLLGYPPSSSESKPYIGMEFEKAAHDIMRWTFNNAQDYERYKKKATADLKKATDEANRLKADNATLKVEVDNLKKQLASQPAAVSGVDQQMKEDVSWIRSLLGKVFK